MVGGFVLSLNYEIKKCSKYKLSIVILLKLILIWVASLIEGSKKLPKSHL
jgi:hypothetical protein